MIIELLPEIKRLQNKEGQTQLVFESGATVTFVQPENFIKFIEPKTGNIPRLLLISGESESGKSTFGKYGLETGYANRVKIYKVIANLQERGVLPAIMLPKDKREHGFIYDPLAVSTMIAEDPSLQGPASDKVVEEFLIFHQNTHVNVDVVEAIKHPWIIERLKSRSDLKALSIFIEAPFDIRATRQADYLNLPSDEVAVKVRDKDSWKNSMGNQRVRQNADVLINNSGSKNDYLVLMNGLLTTTFRVSNSASREAVELS